MAQSLVKNHVHIIFSTKYRNDFIDEDIEVELYKYVAAICKDLESTAIQIGGTDNHIHILCLLSRKIALMTLVQKIKAYSSKWIKTKGPKYENFFWQDGYGAFSVCKENLSEVTLYVKNERERHKRVDFKTEMLTILKDHEVAYDEKYLWD